MRRMRSLRLGMCFVPELYRLCVLNCAWACGLERNRKLCLGLRNASPKRGSTAMKEIRVDLSTQWLDEIFIQQRDIAAFFFFMKLINLLLGSQLTVVYSQIRAGIRRSQRCF